MAIVEQHSPPEAPAATSHTLVDNDLDPFDAEAEADPFGFRPSDDRRERPETD